MAEIFFKFKISKCFESIPIQGRFISTKDLVKAIKRKCKSGNDHGLALYNAQNEEEYMDESSLIPANSWVLVCCIPRHQNRITLGEAKPWAAEKWEPLSAEKSPHQPLVFEEPYSDDFGDDVYAIPDAALVVQPIKPKTEVKNLVTGRRWNCPVPPIPLELRCFLCKQAMKDAVITRNCCFRSFCNRCIRDYICSRSACICGDMGMLEHDLVPNFTLRELIKGREMVQLPELVSLEEMSSQEMVQLPEQVGDFCQKRKRC